MDGAWRCDSVTYREDISDGDLSDTVSGTVIVSEDVNGEYVLWFYKEPTLGSKMNMLGNSYGNIVLGGGAMVGSLGVSIAIAIASGRGGNAASAAGWARSDAVRFAKEKWSKGLENVNNSENIKLAYAEWKRQLYISRCTCKFYRSNDKLLLCFREDNHVHNLCIPDHSRDKEHNDILLECMKQCKELKKGQ